MSMTSRREYVSAMSQRYGASKQRQDKSALIDEVVKVLGCHRKHAARVLRKPLPLKQPPRSRQRPRR